MSGKTNKIYFYFSFYIICKFVLRCLYMYKKSTHIINRIRWRWAYDEPTFLCLFKVDKVLFLVKDSSVQKIFTPGSQSEMRRVKTEVVKDRYAGNLQSFSVTRNKRSRQFVSYDQTSTSYMFVVQFYVYTFDTRIKQVLIHNLFKK